MFASCTGVCASLESVKVAGSWNFDQETTWNVWALKLAFMLIVCMHLSAGEKECWCLVYY